MAAATPQPGARVQAIVSVRIISGERISFEALKASGSIEPAQLRQRSRILRQDGKDGQSELRLVEFQ